ncbi:hypothetical protein [Mesorhizobium sp. CAU 1732]|uniref:hypothetical protein n=1 Tax=Mesorhizobium sp. CAU 1732 TaxID=3140358 RepID=UPI0032609F78
MDALAIRADGRFHQAVVDYCETMIEPAPAGWPVRKLLNQLERYYSAYMLIGQYYGWRNHGASVPNLSRLQAIAGQSPRQTASYCLTLQTRKLVYIETLATDRRQKILRPSDSLVSEVGRSCAAFVASYDAIAGSALACPVAQEADVLGEMIYLSAARVRRSGTVIAVFPRVLALSGYDCGYPMLVALILAHYRLRSGKEVFSLTHSALAERFQISESHVGNVLGYMRQVGAFVPARGRDDDIVAEAFVEEFERWCAAEMAHYADLAAKSVAVEAGV